MIDTIEGLNYFRDISVETLISHPEYISVLRASTVPPLAIDRLAGLAGVSRSVMLALEEGRLPKRIAEARLHESVAGIVSIVSRLLDFEIFPWLKDDCRPSQQCIDRCSSIVADRISGTLADPIIRNSQELRQFEAIDSYLTSKGYTQISSGALDSISLMPAKTFAHHQNVPVKISTGKVVNMPVDVVIRPDSDSFPVLVECKSAGDFANTNKRRKEEATKMNQLRATYGDGVVYVLFLCGYFDASYLGYEASENIDWVWEHRITDFSEFGI